MRHCGTENLHPDFWLLTPGFYIPKGYQGRALGWLESCEPVLNLALPILYLAPL